MRPNRQARASGFTIVELAIVLVILGILASLAVPSFNNMIENARLRTAAESIRSGLQLARTEAVRLNTLVRFQLTTAGGWRVFRADVATCTSDTSATCIQIRTPGEASANVTANGLRGDFVTPETIATYNSFGRLADANPLARVDISITGNTRPLRVELAPGGSIRMCENSTYLSSGDPRRCT